VATPFSAQLTAQIPYGPGQPPQPIVAALSSAYNVEAISRFNFTGSGSKTLDLSTLGSTGAKFVLLTVDPNTAPGAVGILAGFNGATPGIEVSCGGFLVLASPQPTSSGVLALAIAYTASVNVSVWVFG
jgi:hypothetical protein